MTNLDSILKSRDITLPIKVHLFNAMVFPVVVYGCEIWNIKKLSAKKLMLVNVSDGMVKVKSDAVRTVLHSVCNITSINQDQLDMIKHKIARLNIDIIGISKLKWMGMSKLNSDDHYI